MLIRHCFQTVPFGVRVVFTLLTGDGGVGVGVTVTVEGGAQALAVSPGTRGYSCRTSALTMEHTGLQLQNISSDTGTHGYSSRTSAVTLEHKGL